MFGNNHTALFSNSRGWKTLYTSHSTVFRLLWVINDNGHLPKYKLSSQTGFRNTSWWMWTNIFFFFCGMYLFINKTKDTLKFHLHIVMHESTALAMPCTERKGIDSINQKKCSHIFQNHKSYVCWSLFNQRSSSKGNIVFCTCMASLWWFGLIWKKEVCNFHPGNHPTTSSHRQSLWWIALEWIG